MYEQDALNEALDRITDLEREVARLNERYEGLSAEETYNRTVEYIMMNKPVWDRLKNDALHAVDSNERFSIAKEFEVLRESKWLERNEHEQYKCNNSYRACIVRFLLVEIPQLRKLVAIRRSKIDKFFPQLWDEVAA